MGEGPINHIATQDILDCHHFPCPVDTSSNGDSKLGNPTDHPFDNVNSSVYTMAIHPEMKQMIKMTHILL